MSDSPQPDSSSPKPPSSDRKSSKAGDSGKEQPESAPSFFAELKRRKVYRVAVTYAVVAWLLIQVASNTFSSFGIPDWVFRFVVIALILCFPVAVLLAWAFELTPQGVKPTQRIEGGGKSTAPRASRNAWLPITLAAAAPTLIFGGLAMYFYFGSDESSTRESVDGQPYRIGSVAVLPIDVIAGDDAMRTFAEGLHDEILTQLSAMEPLDVISRTTSLQFRDPTSSVQEIGETLGVDFVVEGAIQRVGGDFRLTLQLIETARDHHLESKTYDQEFATNTLLLDQKKLAWKSAIGIYKRLFQETPPEGRSAERYRAKMELLHTELREMDSLFWNDEGEQVRIELLQPLLSMARKVIAADPLYGEAYRRYLTYKGQESFQRFADFGKWIEEMEIAVDQALLMQPDHYDTQVHVGTYYMYALGQPVRALPYLRRGVTLYEANPEKLSNWPYYHLSWALYLTGSPPSGLKVLQRVPEPPDLDQLFYWKESFELSRQFEQGIEFLSTQLERAKELQNPQAVLDISRSIAEFEARWSGSIQPVRDFYDSIVDDPHATVAFRCSLLYKMGEFEDALELLAMMDVGSTGYLAPDGMDFITMKGVALKESGHEELSKSFLEKAISSLEASQSLFLSNPGTGYAVLASFQAYVGNKEAANEAIRKAERFLDATNNLPGYYLNTGLIARAHIEMGDLESAVKHLDFMLSGPSGSSAGRVMLDFDYDELRAYPPYEAVIREHSDQLKDASILETYFEVKSDMTI